MLILVLIFSIYFRITTEEFLEDLGNAKLTFPTLDISLLYRPYRVNASGQAIGIQGSFYSKYRYYLCEGRRAGIIPKLPDRSRRKRRINSESESMAFYKYFTTFYVPSVELL